MTNSLISVVFLDNTDPGAGGLFVLAAWFVLFVLVLNTIIFTLRRLFRRRRNDIRQGERQA
jgi:hypothetical protein